MKDMFDYLLSQYENAKNFVKHGDYKENGIWYCGKCRTPKQTEIEYPEHSGKIRRPFTDCQCYSREEEAIKNQKKREETERRKRICFPDDVTRLFCFEADDHRHDETAMEHVRNYAENFDIMYHEKHLGLLLFGNTGTGKSFAAACVANVVLDKGYTCYFTNFSSIFSDLWDAQKKSCFMQELADYDLLVIDDFGVERVSEYTNEIITNVIDSRCRNRKPVILTSNLSPEQFSPYHQDKDISKKRIYSRLFQMVIPIKFEGKDSRIEMMYRNLQDVSKILGLNKIS